MRDALWDGCASMERHGSGSWSGPFVRTTRNRSPGHANNKVYDD
ncbi:protein of unassigned function [Methylobacterium oryzae CBMB20]|uniref:Protein of unassigned function n=1 Tax=Methylobacterium oryzae CBMB20 TaxID=693986 RepID=A0A089NND8_9HYPH|nr:protein of unassigned function [Methylobacterium oryzae CBMB20]